MRKIVLDFFWKPKTPVETENEILLKRIEQFSIERAILKQIISDCIKDNDVDTCEFQLSEEFINKYKWHLRNTEMKAIWIIVERWCKEQKENKVQC
jgi:hypothetical protein